MVLAVFCLNISHPGIAFGDEKRPTEGVTYTVNSQMTEMKKQDSSSE